MNQGIGRHACEASMRIFRIIFFATIFLSAISPAIRAQTLPGQIEIADLALPTGGSERVLFIGTHPSYATVILLSGGDGVFTIDNAGNVTPGGNFLVRTRDLWAAQHFGVVVPGPPNGQSLTGRRSTPAYAGELDRVVDFARSRSNAPVWLVGTSQGSIAAVNGGAHLGAKVAGVVLTSSITRPSQVGETIFDAAPGLISVPTLVVANSADTCRSTPPEDAPSILAALVRSPRKELMMFDSREIRSDPCRARSPHGYLGIETAVVQRIADWIRSTPAR
ncbi:MAG TPA: alpha/beta hydrolase [Stellaceae bacterium]|nr:alpha/beta hydrolase [Stellaceae bacterium]